MKAVGMDDTPVDLKQVTGLDLPPERFLEVLKEFKAILVEIEKLRQLDMGETHPAIIYRPIMNKSTP